MALPVTLVCTPFTSAPVFPSTIAFIPCSVASLVASIAIAPLLFTPVSPVDCIFTSPWASAAKSPSAAISISPCAPIVIFSSAVILIFLAAISIVSVAFIVNDLAWVSKVMILPSLS